VVRDAAFAAPHHERNDDRDFFLPLPLWERSLRFVQRVRGNPVFARSVFYDEAIHSFTVSISLDEMKHFIEATTDITVYRAVKSNINS
jgi:hypothetical protein